MPYPMKEIYYLSLNNDNTGTYWLSLATNNNQAKSMGISR